jgi:hypothetical protein
MPNIKSLQLLKQYLDNNKEISFNVKTKIIEFAWNIALEGISFNKKPDIK